MNNEEIQRAQEDIKKFLYLYYDRHKNGKFKNLSLDQQISKLKKYADDQIDNYDYKDLVDDEFVNNCINSLTVFIDKPIVFEDGYKPWLENSRSKILWEYSERYEDYLMSIKKWDLTSIRSISSSTDDILDHCGNPLDNYNFAVKGLVIGDIQSGKTANYTSLINKAIDAGYKMIIVLAGLTRDLRSQTQKRLDLEVLGYETKDNLQKGETIGVGKIENVKRTINCLTGSDMDGDIKKYAQTYRFDGNTVFLAIVKKNTSVLRKLIDFIKLNPAVKESDDHKFNYPALVIDDEADQASINTKKGKKENLEEASATNKLIRQFLNCLNKYSYVGYTATPFANIFVPPFNDAEYSLEQKDIFPENFIICLPTPENYSGVSDYFGDNTLDIDGIDNYQVDLFREINIDDLKKTFGTENGKTNKNTNVIGFPDSLKEAMMHFLIASGVKFSRGIKEHNSMIIHISSNVCPNKQLKDRVEEELDTLVRGFKFVPKVEKEFETYWFKNMSPVSRFRLGDKYKDNWNNIKKGIIEALRLVTRTDTVKVLVGDSDDIIDYDTAPTGMHIVIGGSKLSRGLTLNGLIVSYYARHTKMYDTLLQMGRWFGYRKGWLDLCRVYTSRDIFNDFVCTAQAVEEFKQDIEYMNKRKYTPKEFGLKVKTSPGLLPTSSSKMRYAERTLLSFSGELQQTISFDIELKGHNREVTKDFVSKLGAPKFIRNKKLIYKDVPSDKLIEYLEDYRECQGKGRISIKYWIEYIKKLTTQFNELTNWTVVVHSLSEKNNRIGDYLIPGHEIYKPLRITRDLNEKGTKLNIKVLTNPTDFFEFYDDDVIKNKMIAKGKANYAPGEPEIRETFTSKNGLLTIYIFDIAERLLNDDLNQSTKKYKRGNIVVGADGLIGLGIWFSESKHIESSSVDYYVNEIYQNFEQDQNRAAIEEEDFDE